MGIRDRFAPVLLASLALALMSGTPAQLSAQTAAAVVPAPVVTPLRAYRDGLLAPARIATDPLGRVYITDSSAGKVVVRDEFGRLTAGKRGLAGPLGIAVDASGLIYVGEEGTGSVSVFLPNWSLLGKLGKGNGEFLLPNHIAIAPDATGLVYVADSGANLIKVYTSGGTLVRQFGSMGTAPGQFDFPAGIFVAANGEVFVADQNNNRVQVFTSAGQFLRSFGRSSSFGSYFGRIQGLAGDSQGRVLVADTFQGLVRVATSDGTIVSTIGTFGQNLGELSGPTSLVIDRNNRLFVVAAGNTRVEVYGLDTYVDPKILPAIVELRPSALVRSDRGRFNFVTTFLKIPGVDPRQIDKTSVQANGVGTFVKLPGVVGDFDRDGISELMLWFDYAKLVATLPNGPGVVTVTGRLLAGAYFEGSATVSVVSGPTTILGTAVDGSSLEEGGSR